MSFILDIFEVLKDRVFDFSFILDPGFRGDYLNGLYITLLLSVSGVILGTILGLIIGVMKISDSKILKALATMHINYYRGTPLLVQLYIVYYLPSELFKINFDPIVVGIIAIGLNSAAYVAEIFRAGIASVDKGQFEAGRSLGFSKNQTLIKIVIPQAFKNILPALANEFIVIIKETAIVSVIALKDIMYFTKEVGSITYNYLPAYIFTSLVYLVIILGLTQLVTLLERKLNND